MDIDCFLIHIKDLIGFIFFMLDVLFSHSCIGFFKNPDAKHTINFKQF